MSAAAANGDGDGTRSSAPAWRTPGREGPGGLQSMGLRKSQTKVRNKTATSVNVRLCHTLKIISFIEI